MLTLIVDGNGVVSSGGTYPVSLTLSGNVLYALNSVGEGSVAGFRVTRSGQW